MPWKIQPIRMQESPCQFINTPRVYTEKIEVTRGIFHSILLENININHSFNKYLMNALHQAGIYNRVYIVNEPR